MKQWAVFLHSVSSALNTVEKTLISEGLDVHSMLDQLHANLAKFDYTSITWD
uniref:Uncharacterized protein n=1 Tax=Anguilla anguilla TaxID=7936 RepID=A0A0E9QLA5_ANGAN